MLYTVRAHSTRLSRGKGVSYFTQGTMATLIRVCCTEAGKSCPLSYRFYYKEEYTELDCMNDLQLMCGPCTAVFVVLLMKENDAETVKNQLVQKNMP